MNFCTATLIITLLLYGNNRAPPIEMTTLETIFVWWSANYMRQVYCKAVLCHKCSFCKHECCTSEWFLIVGCFLRLVAAGIESPSWNQAEEDSKFCATLIRGCYIFSKVVKVNSLEAGIFYWSIPSAHLTGRLAYALFVLVGGSVSSWFGGGGQWESRKHGVRWSTARFK